MCDTASCARRSEHLVVRLCDRSDLVCKAGLGHSWCTKTDKGLCFDLKTRSTGQSSAKLSYMKALNTLGSSELACSGGFLLAAFHQSTCARLP
jgi:hypothetical protein